MISNPGNASRHLVRQAQRQHQRFHRHNQQFFPYWEGKGKP